VPTLADELRVIACYKVGDDLSDRLKAADDVQRQQAAALLRAADEIDRLGGMKDLIDAVLQWAMDRRIIPNSNAQAQLLKCMSELGELADATLKKDDAEIVDGVGDVLVTLILYSELQGMNIENCLKSAYNEIKDRRGTLTPEGVFCKDA
jgi:NTP pyrophosphatase (non-canonical NTP hydrolase)